ncbi:MAG: zinc ABC transporter substrate-binding protein, partial [Candidatus Scalindua sp.]|nr:zinc ABC transporter substrate-binding protein [Candidatus Scalindua sp.]
MLKGKISKSITILSFSIFIFIAIFNSGNAHAKKLKIITTSTDLKSIAEYIGGNKVNVESLTKGYANPHEVDAKPSFMVKLRKADVFIRIGLDLEQWAQLL